MSVALVVWFSGLSGSGKSTIAEATSDLLTAKGLTVDIVDGDEVRRTAGKHLGFSAGDVMESNDLAIGICQKKRQTCDVVLVPRVSPMHEGRQIARKTLGERYMEVYIQASVDTVQSRDPKGLYERARNGQAEPLIGMPGALPFDTPNDSDLVLDTEETTEQVLADRLANYITDQLEAKR
jgi:adenylyl-sulfate kinase